MKINIIEYIIKNNNLKQKDIADALAVSRAQISKWKAGEDIPHDREKELLKLAGLFGFDSSWAILVKTEENSQAWIDYMRHMNDVNDDTYSSRSFDDESEICTPIVIQALCELGLAIPDCPPSIETLEDYENYEFTSFDNFICEYLTNYGPINAWCDKYLSEEDDGYVVYDMQQNISCHYPIYLALKYVNRDLLETNGINLKRLDSKLVKEDREARKDIHHLCLKLRDMGISFKTDYFDLVNKHPYELDDIITFSGAIRYSPNSGIAMEEYFSFSERKILEETRVTRMMLEKLHEKLDQLTTSKDD